VDVVPQRGAAGGAAMEAVQTVRDLIRFSLVSSPITHARVYVSSSHRVPCFCLSSVLFGSV